MSLTGLKTDKSFGSSKKIIEVDRVHKNTSRQGSNWIIQSSNQGLELEPNKTGTGTYPFYETETGIGTLVTI